MISDYLKLISKALLFYLPLLPHLALQRLAALLHRRTYLDIPSSQNVVVIGGSFAGLALVKHLSSSLPSGFKIVWIEKNSHLNYTFTFPRFSVLPGHEHKSFIPYDGLAGSAPPRILTRIQDRAVGITKTHVRLASGEEINYTYLAIATGSSQPLPAQVLATERRAACRELRGVQDLIKTSANIAIVGGGAVGVEMASDIKDFYPDKEVTLVHSRGRLLSAFGGRLGEFVLRRLRDELGIRVLLNERPEMSGGGSMVRDATLTFSDGREEEFDLIISCTGQRPNSSILSSLLPAAISKQNSRILVHPTLQIRTADDEPCTPPDHPAPQGTRIFALGDVADHSGPRMARAGFMQAGVVAANILSMVRGRAAGGVYRPNLFVEGAVKLTLGRGRGVVYAVDAHGSEALVVTGGGRVDLDVGRAWRMLGADLGMADIPDRGGIDEAVGSA